MKKIAALLSVLIVVLSSCAKDGEQSVWGGGLFLVPIILLGAAAYLGRLGYKYWTSGSVTGGNANQPLIESDKRVPVYLVWPWVFGAVLALFAIGMLIFVK